MPVLSFQMVSQLAIFFDAKPTFNPSTELEPLPPRIDLQRIYSDYMRYLLGHTQSRLVDATGEDLWENHGASADIVLTHPNLWDRDQRRFLKKAAIDAGLISKERSEGQPSLCRGSGSRVPILCLEIFRYFWQIEGDCGLAFALEQLTLMLSISPARA